MESEFLNQRKLLEISGNYWKTFTLHAAVKLDIFSKIGFEGINAEILARNIDSNPQNTGRLLNSLVAMGLLENKEGTFFNTESTRKYLSKDSDEYIGFMILHHHNLVQSWSKLDECVTTGKPTRERSSHDNESIRESFLMGMFNNAMLIAPYLAKELDLSGRKKILDLGGGPGTYAIQFCIHNHDLKGVVFDLPTTKKFAEKTIDKFGLKKRISFVGGDFEKDDLTGSYDVIWISQVLHSMSTKTCKNIIKKAYSVIESGGLIAIHEFILDESRCSPLFPVLFDLNMMIGTPDGKSYAENELREMLKEAGFKNMKRLFFNTPNSSGIITAKK